MSKVLAWKQNLSKFLHNLRLIATILIAFAAAGCVFTLAGYLLYLANDYFIEAPKRAEQAIPLEERLRTAEVKAKEDYDTGFQEGYKAYYPELTLEYQHDVLQATEEGKRKTHLRFRNAPDRNKYYNKRTQEGFYTGFIKAMQENLPELKIDTNPVFYETENARYFGVYAEW